MSAFGKKIIFWTYGRSTWQYDVLCALILAFIFLTPKSWFDTSERTRAGGHPNSPAATTLLLTWPAEAAAAPSTQELQRHAQTVSGRPDVRVRGAHPLRDEAGRVVAYQVDIE